MEALKERPSVTRLTKDLKEAAKTISAQEARYLVDAYYIFQEDRKRYDNQVRSMVDTQEPSSVISWLSDNSHTMENQIKRALDAYTDNHPAGQWMKSVHGIGPVITAGLLAHIDITIPQTAGAIWRYAGLDPTNSWLGKEKSQDLVDKYQDNTKDFDELVTVCAAAANRNIDSTVKLVNALIAEGEVKGDAAKRRILVKVLSRRPWNADLRTLCWKAGQCFMKFSNDDACFYGKHYRDKKAYYIVQNEAGAYKDIALQRAKEVGKSTEAYKSYSIGKLPAGHIDARARRHAVKLFLAHLFEVWYEIHHGKPAPLPYPIAILKHAHQIPVPRRASGE